MAVFSQIFTLTRAGNTNSIAYIGPLADMRGLRNCGESDLANSDVEQTSEISEWDVQLKPFLFLPCRRCPSVGRQVGQAFG